MTTIDVQVGGASALPQSSELASSMSSTAVTSGWYRDPSGQHEMRYNNGQHWTEHVTHSGPTPCQGCSSH